MAPAKNTDAAEVREVWAWNLDQEFIDLVAAVSDNGQGGAIVALDMEFPGFLRQQPRSDAPGAQAAKYQALRENVDHLRPIQLGVAVAGPDGVLRGVWSFNLQFNLNVDLHTEKSIAFLRGAGIDFQRLATEGIEAATLGQRLARSRLVKSLHGSKLPQWVTFSGTYDFGYFVKLLTANRPLPYSSVAYDAALETFCPHRYDLREHLPHGSLDAVARKNGLQRRGIAHTAGSDALLTMDVFLRVVGVFKGSKGEHTVKWDMARGQGEAWHAEDLNTLSTVNNDWPRSWGWEKTSSMTQSMMGWEKESWDKPLSGWEDSAANETGWEDDAANWDYSWSWALPPPMPCMFWGFPPMQKLA